MSSRTRRLVVTLVLNLALVAGQAVGGAVSHSLGLLADAGHNLTDAAGVALALWAVRWTLRPRSPERSFGYHRGTILAALVNAGTITAVTIGIAVESVGRLLHPHAVHGGTVVAVAAAALVVNGIAALVLAERHGDLNMRSALVHMAGDAVASLAVVAAGAVLMVSPSTTWVDPAASLAVAALIVAEAYRLLRAAVDVLLEAAPADLDLAALTGAMTDVPGVAEVHDLHVWSLSSEVRALSAHVVVAGHPSLEQAQAIGERVKAVVGGPFDIAHATLELECERCTEGDVDPCLMDALGEPAPPAPRDVPVGQHAPVAQGAAGGPIAASTTLAAGSSATSSHAPGGTAHYGQAGAPGGRAPTPDAPSAPVSGAAPPPR